MRRIVAELEALIQSRLRALWPEISVAARARPLFDQERGDFAFDCCLAIGAMLKRRPEEVSAEIAAGLPEQREFEWRQVDGFINARIRDVDCLLAAAEPYSGSDELPRAIIIQPRTDSLSETAFCRLGASAVIQTVLARRLGGETALYVGDAPCSGASFEDLSASVEARSLVVDPGAALTALRRMLDGGTVSAVVWISPLFLERSEFRRFYIDYFADDGGGSRCLRCPGRGWFEGFQEAWGMLPPRDKASRAAHLLTLASRRTAAELDPHTAELKEQGNLPWFCGATAERLERLLGSQVELRPTGEAALPGLDYQRTLARLMTLPFFERAAASRGEVAEWIDVLDSLLRSINLIMNTPEQRRLLAAQTAPAEVVKILSGAHKAVSDIIQNNPLFYKAAP